MGTPTRSSNEWAGRIDKWRASRPLEDVYLYFDNDAKVHAPFDAQKRLINELAIRL